MAVNSEGVKQDLHLGFTDCGTFIHRIAEKEGVLGNQASAKYRSRKLRDVESTNGEAVGLCLEFVVSFRKSILRTKLAATRGLGSSDSVIGTQKWCLITLSFAPLGNLYVLHVIVEDGNKCSLLIALAIALAVEDVPIPICVG